jgi:integrase
MMSKAKAVLVARVNDGTGKFPFVNVTIKKNAVRLPIEANGRVYEPDSVLGYFARYPHVVGNCVFPDCTGKVSRHVQTLGKDHVEAYAKYQRIERDFSRVREGKLPVEPPKQTTKGRSLEEAISKFEEECKAKQRKQRTVESYAKSLEQFAQSCAAIGIKTVDQIDKSVMLKFVSWLEKNLQTRTGGHPNNTYRNKLKDVRVFLIDIGVGMPLKPKDWPKAVKARKEKYSVEAVKGMLAAADSVKRHDNNRWSADDDKDLIHFLLKTGFRDDEIAHAQFSDIKNGTVNVNPKSCDCRTCQQNGGKWTPKNNSARERDIVVDNAFIKRMKNRMQRYGAKSTDLIFPNGKGKPNQHLIRVIQRVAEEAGIQGHIGLHKFRKTYATMVANEEGIEAARILLGHEDVATTQRYLAADEVAPEQDRKAVKKRYAQFGD